MPANGPTLISFFGGDEYYYRAAEALRADCDRLGIAHDIREVARREGEDWAAVCRRKIPFYAEMLDRHPNGVFWVDVDTRLLRRPELLDDARYDVAAFLRGFRDFRRYDPVQVARTFHPGFLHFNGTRKTRDFVNHLAALEADSTVKGTDDYFLEEGWRTFKEHLALMILPPDLIVRRPERQTPESCFLFGESGNVNTFKSQVEQHSAPIFDLRRQTRLLIHYAAQAIRIGKREHARIFLNKAHAIDPTDEHASLSLAKLCLKMDEPALAAKAIRDTFGGDTNLPEPRMVLADAALDVGHWRRADVNVKRLESLDDPQARAFAASRRELIGLERRAEELGVATEDRPKLYWMDTPFPGNLGDILNPYLVEKLSGIPPRKSRAGEGILAIGSVIKFARAGTVVWGTGTPRLTDQLSPDADYRAVRGPLTRQLVQASGGRAPDVFGDPAMLLPLLYTPKVRKRYRLGLIRHYTHADEPLQLDGVREISILRVGADGIERFIDEVCECEAIVSSSLHGLIVAHAYGIPTRWGDFPGSERSIPGDSTKFQDHYAAFGIGFRPPSNLSDLKVLTPDFASHCDEVVTKPFDADALLSAAPFPIRFQLRSPKLETV